MRFNPLNVRLETLVAASPMLGHELEDRRIVRDAQDPQLVDRFTQGAQTPLRSQSQRDLFCIAPLDLLVSQRQGRKQFHLLELNGTGIGGLTNLPDQVIGDALGSLSESCAEFDDPEGVVLLAVSGKESQSNPRRNRLMHEKLLFVDAIRQGLDRRFGRSSVACAEDPRQAAAAYRPGTPTVVLGYIKDLLERVTLDEEGVVHLYGRRVMGAVNDRFCRNMLHRFDDGVDLQSLQTLNRCFAAGSDKGVAYALMNECLQANPHPLFPKEVRYSHAACRLSLIETVLRWLGDGRQPVIKPHGTGLGHGIEFFFDPEEDVESIVARIDRSLSQTEEYYNLPGGALPYTVCDYVDACRVRAAGHRFHGHKYELRVVVYRQGGALRAFPMIAKVARECEDASGKVRRALINNITASGDTGKVNGADYMLPLCNHRTLEMLGLTADEMESLCIATTEYVRHILDQIEDQPERFGLPAPEGCRVLRPAEAAA